MKGSGERKSIDTAKQARQVLGLPFLDDKIICFVSTWERSRINPFMPTEEDEKEYSFQEPRLFQLAIRLWKREGEFSFIAFREFGELNEEEISFKETEEHKKRISKVRSKVPSTRSHLRTHIKYNSKLDSFLTKKSIAHMLLSGLCNDLVGCHITLLPASIDYGGNLQKMHEIVELHDLNILCIDYSRFPSFLISKFIRYMEMKRHRDCLPLTGDLRPLLGVFNKISPDMMITYQWIKTWIDRAFSDSLDVEDWDQIEFLSMNHLQNMALPSFWQNIGESGYLCKENVGDIGGVELGELQDVRVFYSLESLLFYELRNCLKRIRRCRNCGSILGVGYKGRYCPEGSGNYEKCCAERNRKRQRKHYDLTKA